MIYVCTNIVFVFVFLLYSRVTGASAVTTDLTMSYCDNNHNNNNNNNIPPSSLRHVIFGTSYDRAAQVPRPGSIVHRRKQKLKRHQEHMLFVLEHKEEKYEGKRKQRSVSTYHQ